MWAGLLFPGIEKSQKIQQNGKLLHCRLVKLCAIHEVGVVTHV
jgi:hypothetical protein